MRNVTLAVLLLATTDCLAQFQFVAPMPGSTNHSPEQIIVLREGHELSEQLLSNHRWVSVIGSQSGEHDCTVELSDDHKTINLISEKRYAYGETVKVKTNEKLLLADGSHAKPMEFNFSIHRKYTPEELAGFAAFLQNIRSEGAGDSIDMKPISPEKKKKALDVTVNISPSPGDIFYDFFCGFVGGNASIHVANNNGDSIYFQRKGTYVYDFKINHNGYLTLFNGNSIKWEELDSNYHRMRTFVAVNGYVTDEHEFQIFPDGHYYLIAEDPEIVDMTVYNSAYQPDATVVGSVIQEFDANDHLIFEWRSFDHIIITEALHEYLGSAYIDAMHTNSIEEDHDGNILVSHRNLDQVTKIDVHTGDFIWRWGGVKNEFAFINDPAQFNYQHDVRRIPNGNITMMDNHGWGFPALTSAKEYKLDEIKKQATLVWSYQHPTIRGLPVNARFMGSVQRFDNGNTLINWGWLLYHGSDFPQMTEVDVNNNIVWEAVLTPGLYNITYRAHRYEWNPCARPTSRIMEATEVTATSANLTWGFSTGAKNYDIQYRVKGTSDWTSVNAGGNVSNKIITGLQPNTPYQWQLQSVCDSPASPFSAYSNIKKFMTLELPDVLNENAISVTCSSPAPDQIYVTVTHDMPIESLKLELINEMGQCVYHQVIPPEEENNLRIPIQTLANGVYVVRVYDRNVFSVSKVEVLH